VVFNWGYNSSYGGERQQEGNPKFSTCVVNMVANYYKPGPATIPGQVAHRIINPSSSGRGFGKWFVADNFMYGNAAVTADNWNGGVQPQRAQSGSGELTLDEPWPAMPIRQQSAEEAYHAVLRDVGATWPKRDAVDCDLQKLDSTQECSNRAARLSTKTVRAVAAMPFAPGARVQLSRPV